MAREREPATHSHRAIFLFLFQTQYRIKAWCFWFVDDLNMAMVTLPEQHRTPAIQLPHGGQFDCGASPRQCRFFALDGGVSKVSQDTNNVSESTAMMVDEGMGEVAAAAAATAFQVPFGAKSTKGRRPNMEDCDTVVENFTTLRVCCYPKEGILPEALQSQVGVNQLWSSPVDSYMSEDCSIYSESSSNGSDVSSLERCNNGLDSQTITSTFQYAAVFDGHGGSAVSIALSKKLHLILRKELEGINSADGELTINHIASGMKNSFITMDSQLGDEAKTAGSTGVVSLISGNHIIVANCGDSRAVLCRQQQAFKLSRDHKPSHPDEQVKTGYHCVW